MIRFGIRLPVPGPFYAYIPLGRRGPARIKPTSRRELKQRAAASESRLADLRTARYHAECNAKRAEVAAMRREIDRLGPNHMKSIYLQKQLDGVSV